MTIVLACPASFSVLPAPAPQLSRACPSQTPSDMWHSGFRAGQTATQPSLCCLFGEESLPSPGAAKSEGCKLGPWAAELFSCLNQSFSFNPTKLSHLQPMVANTLPGRESPHQHLKERGSWLRIDSLTTSHIENGSSRRVAQHAAEDSGI